MEADLNAKEVTKRRDDPIRRAVNTPPSPLKDKPKKRPKASKTESDPAKPKSA